MIGSDRGFDVQVHGGLRSFDTSPTWSDIDGLCKAVLLKAGTGGVNVGAKTLKRVACAEIRSLVGPDKATPG